MKVLIGFAILLVASHTAHSVLRGKRPWFEEIYFTAALHETSTGNLTCGGVIIAKDWILTAASCAQHPTDLEAIAGSLFALSVTLSSNTWQRRLIDYAVVHDKYTVGEYHDNIALLHLNAPFEWTEHVRPVALPQPDAVPSGEVRFFGLGQSVIGYPTTSYAFDWQRIIVNILDWDLCRPQLPQNLKLDQQMVCTEQIARQSFCSGGDLGGPLVMEREKNNSLLVGIANWAYSPCGFSQYPNVYTQVSLYLDWIEDSMKRLH